MRNITLQDIARAINGKVLPGSRGPYVQAAGPGHRPGDDSMTVSLSPTAPDGFVVNTFSPRDDWRDCRDYVRERLGLPNDGWKRQNTRATAARQSPPIVEHVAAFDDDAERRTREALAIWNASRDITGTLGERYLHSRGLVTPDQIEEEPFLRWSDQINALVALFRDTWSATPKAISRIFLDREGQKLRPSFKGPVGGCAICVEHHADVQDVLTVGEGLETVLAARQMGFRGCWAMGSAGGIGSLRLIPGVSTLYVLGEPGPANAKAVRDVSARWIADGRKVIVAHPEIGADMNDALAGRIVGKAVA